MKIFLILALVATLSKTHVAQACSCMPISAWNKNTVQRTLGLYPDAVVAQVKRIGLTKAGSTILEVEKVFKGSITAKTIRVRGPNGISCYEPLMEKNINTGVVMLQPSGSLFETMGCGINNLEINPENSKVKVPFESGIAELNDQEFKSFLSGQLNPTEKGLSCSVYGSQRAIDTSDDVPGKKKLLSDEAQEALNEKISYQYAVNFEGRGGILEATPAHNQNSYVQLKELGDVYLRARVQHLMDKTQISYQVSDMTFTESLSGFLSDPNKVGEFEASHRLSTDLNGKTVPESYAGPIIHKSIDVRCELSYDLPLQ
jgi:hypothetical protein